MFSLAPIRYRRAVCPTLGPIRNVETGWVSVLGEACAVCEAYLIDNLIARPDRARVFGRADGTAVHASVTIARYMAISAAFERWAHLSLLQSPERAAYGFDLDPTATGLAAFPGATARGARRCAWYNAVGRWSLLAWWEGRLASRSRLTRWGEAVEAEEILTPLSGVTTVLLHLRLPEGFHAYAHAAGPDFDRAAAKAALRLAHNRVVLERLLRQVGAVGGPNCADLADEGGRRILFFATETGHALLRRRLGAAPARPLAPQVLVDREVPGPWTRFSSLWRVLFAPPSGDFLQRRDDCFFW